MSCNFNTAQINFNIVPTQLELTFDDINNLDLLDPTDESEWNTMFDLPIYGSPFTSAIVNSNKVTLIGGSDITLKYGFLGGNAYYLTSIVDTGCIILLESYPIFDGYKGPFQLLTTIEFPYLESIIDNGFAYTKITSFVIGDSTISIGTTIFQTNFYITSITVGKGLTTIASNSFRGTIALEDINVNSDNSNFCDIDGILFNKSQTTILYYGQGRESTSYVIPNSVTSIGDHTFEGCTNLTSITIPSGITSIGDYAFSGCSYIESLTIPNTVTSIGFAGFFGCNSITSLTIPANVTSIGDNAFCGLDITTLTIPSTVTSMGKQVFSGCDLLEDVTISNGITSIPEGEFGQCFSLTQITIPTSVTSIGNAAFYYCESLASIIIPVNVSSIENNAFALCSNLKTIYIYGTSAPIVTNYTFGDYAATLHRVSGASGYLGYPWTNTAKFATIIEDL